MREKSWKRNVKCCVVEFFAVAQFLALCPRVNIAVTISWDILGLKKTIISFYSVCCICIAINVVYILPPSGPEKKKEAKHEDTEREAWI